MGKYELVDLPEPAKKASTYELVDLPEEQPTSWLGGVVKRANDAVGGLQFIKDDPAKALSTMGTAAEQGVTFNQADEIRAMMRSGGGKTLPLIDMLGSFLPGTDNSKAYEKNIAVERAKVQEAKDHLGTGYDLVNMAAGVATPGVNGLRVAQRLAGPGPGVVARTLAMGGTGAAMGTVSALGAQDEKDVSDALLWGGGVGFGFGAGSEMVRTALGPVITYSADAIDRARQVIARRAAARTGAPYVPSERTRNWATREITDQLARDGITTPPQLNAHLARTKIPDTDQAIASINNGQVSGDVVENAKRVTNPGALGYNPVERYAGTQLRNQAGVPQAQAFTTRVDDQVGLTPAQRDPVRMTAELADQREALGGRLGTIRNNGGNTNAPGFAQRIDENPEALAIWREVQKQNVRGSPDFIEPDRIPLPPQQHARAHAAWEAREQAAAAAGLPFAEPPPVLLTDRNVPVALYANFQREASQRGNDGSEAARRLYALNDTEALAHPARRTGAVSTTNRNISNRHDMKKDIDAGARLLSQDPQPRIDSQAEFRRMPQGGPRRENMSIGATHGLKNLTNANADDLGKVADAFGNPDVRRAWDEVVGSVHAGNPRAAHIREEAARIGRTQEFVARTRQVQSARTPEEKNAAEIGLKAFIRMQFTPAAGYASMMKDIVSGRDQSRRLATLDQALDTAPSTQPQSGRGRVLAEMNRRDTARNDPMDWRAVTLINLLAREAGTAAGDNK